jgi:hypothetical protein
VNHFEVKDAGFRKDLQHPDVSENEENEKMGFSCSEF